MDYKETNEHNIIEKSSVYDNPNAGFTLKEMLVVLVISLILTLVISVFFVKYIEKTREQTDVYNMKVVEREFEASYTLGMMQQGIEYYYDTATNGIELSVPSIGYGKGTKAKGGIYYKNYDPGMNVVGQFLCAMADSSGIEVYWNGYKPNNSDDSLEENVEGGNSDEED